MTSLTRGARPGDIPGQMSLSPAFCGARVSLAFIFCVVLCRSLFPFFCQGIVYPSSIYGFWVLHWYLLSTPLVSPSCSWKKRTKAKIIRISFCTCDWMIIYSYNFHFTLAITTCKEFKVDKRGIQVLVNIHHIEDDRHVSVREVEDINTWLGLGLVNQELVLR